MIEDTARPNLRDVEGLWRKTVKGTRGAVPRPGSMGVFIRRLRADPSLIAHYRAMAPPVEPPKLCAGDVVGGTPIFRRRALPMAGAREEICCFEGANEKKDRRRLPLAPAFEELPEELAEALELDAEE